MTKREQVLAALFAVVSAEILNLRWAGAVRNEVVPVEAPPRGLVIVRDGAPGEPEITMSPPVYSYQHRAEIELFAQSASGQEDAVFDAAAEAIGRALAADRTLGGLCDWVEPQAPEPQVIPVQGGAPIKAATIAVILHYDTTDPLI